MIGAAVGSPLFSGCAALFALEYRPFSGSFDEIGNDQ
jgi:hypothetical protein